MKAKAERCQMQTTHLLDAAIEGDVSSLLKLLQEDPLILDRCTVAQSGGHVMQSPLHVAANLGHLEFTKQVLSRNPELAEQFDQLQRRLALHIAAAKGNLEIVQALLAVNSNMSFARDQDGMTPVHVAASNDQFQVLNQLFHAKPQAAQERTNRGETVLHLCVKHNHRAALEFLVNLTDDGELLNSKDAHGNTVLHLAVTTKQLETVEFLLKSKRMNRNAINTNGSTAMDVFVKSRKHPNDGDIRRALERANGLRAKDARLKQGEKLENNIQNHRNALMVVASLIATMAFQVGTQPPGGTWQDKKDGHIAGRSIMADKDERRYNSLVIYSTIGLVSSLTVILLLISGLHGKRLFVAILMITMWIAVTATALNFWVSILFLSGNPKSYLMKWPFTISMTVWLCVMCVLFLAHIVRFTVKRIKTPLQLGQKFYQ